MEGLTGVKRGKGELKFRVETRFLQSEVESKEVIVRGVGSGKGFLLNERKVSWLFADGNDLGEQKSADLGDQGKKCRRDAWGQNW